MVLDTHVFLWYLLDDSRLLPEVRQMLIRDPEQVHVPTVCLWESMMLIQKGRINISAQRADRRLVEFLGAVGFKEAPLTSEIALLSRTLEFEHEDPADRFIAATSQAMGLPLATSDQRLRSLPWLRLAY